MKEITKGKWVFSFWHDWQFTDVNWIDFHFINLYAERDYVTDRVEIVMGLLGINLMIQYIKEDFPGKLKDVIEEARREQVIELGE